jgi:hypothetical protein
MLENDLIDQAIAAMERELPENVARHRLGPKLGNYPSFPFSRGTMQNEDSLGTGPTERWFAGKYCYYTRNSLLNWTRQKLSVA